ncbi:MAG: lipopolysaccharide biosynthesis protein, partial [Planctomycetota bacterium]
MSESSESPAAPAPGRRSQVAWMMTSGVLQSAVAFASNLVLVRYLAPADFGAFALTLASIGLLFGLLHLRTGLLVIRDEAERFDEHRKQLLWSTCVFETVVLGSAATAWLAMGDQLTLWAGVLIAATALQHLANNGRSFLERDEAYHRLAPVEGIAHFLAHGGAAALAVYGVGAAALYLRELFLAMFLCAALWKLGALRPTPIRVV